LVVAERASRGSRAFASVRGGILADIHGVSNRVAVQRQLKDG
jgi:hypothetical protein